MVFLRNQLRGRSAARRGGLGGCARGPWGWLVGAWGLRGTVTVAGSSVTSGFFSMTNEILPVLKAEKKYQADRYIIDVDRTNSPPAKTSGDALSVATIPVGNYENGESLAVAMNAISAMVSAGGGNISIATNEPTAAYKLLGMNLNYNDSLKAVGENATNLLSCVPISVAYGQIQTFKSDSAPYMW
ncbi:hypothetical protein T492DRAFT_842358 [Pavlovales sp. CCMP2436]|nr:hypothetical protein T492DRAFT_842358 [Pavlovales sp. CCMP2436]